MELFLELAFTVSFSLLFSFCFAWFLSFADAAEHDLTKKKTSGVRDFQEDFEVCNLEMETKTRVGFCSELVDDQRPKLFAGEVEKTEEKSVDEESRDYNRGAETAIGFSLDDQSPELYPGKVEEKSLNEAEEAKTQMGLTKEEVGIEEKEEKDNQRSELFHGKVEETQEKSLNEAQEAKIQMGLTNEEMGREEKEEKEHDSTENKSAIVHYFQEEYVKLEDQSLKLSPVEAEETEEKLVDEAQGVETELDLIEVEEIEIKKNEIESEDWVGIERSELERIFGAAVAFVDSKKEKTSSFSSDLKLQFFGLYQVAMAGPCFVPQPMALKFAARAKWDAWQQFGNLSSEDAMEHYINLLSTNFPGWMEENVRGSEISNES